MPMTTRTAVNAVLVLLIPLIEETHTFFDRSKRMVNWWILLDYPLEIQWYLKFLGVAISNVIIALVLYRCSRLNQTFRLVTGVYLLYRLIDVLMFFLCFNQRHYILVYVFLGFAAGVMHYVQSNYENTRQMFDEIKKRIRSKNKNRSRRRDVIEVLN
jgi:hypothetical protein